VVNVADCTDVDMWLGSLILLLCHDILLRIVIKFKIIGAVEQTRTAEPLPYQGSALPTELQQRVYKNSTRNNTCCQYCLNYDRSASFDAYILYYITNIKYYYFN
jgi:hypothetical protein